MTLRRKLLTLFGGLAAIALLVSGVALLITLNWQSAARATEDHFRRSLLLESVRASTFQALREVDDALTGDDSVDARADFDAAVAPAARDFADWAALAHTEAEHAEVARIRDVHQRLLDSAERVFARLTAGDRAGAIQLVDDELDTKDMAQFRRVTDEAVATDRALRQTIQQRTAEVRRTTQILALISLLATLSLALLLAAYLRRDLFGALRDLPLAFDRLRTGEAGVRVDASGNDEIGRLAGSFNALAEHVERLASRTAGSKAVPTQFPDLELAASDLRLLIHDLVYRHRDTLVARGASLELRMPAEFQSLPVDRGRMSTALDDIMRGVIERLPERDGRAGVRLTLDSAAGHARIEFADNGSGMPIAPIDGAHLADARGGGPDAAAALAFARDVAHWHRGSLTIFSEAGGGTVVRLELPT